MGLDVSLHIRIRIAGYLSKLCVEKTHRRSITFLHSGAVLVGLVCVLFSAELDPSAIVVREHAAVSVATINTAGSLLGIGLKNDDSRFFWKIILLTPSGW